MLQVYGKEKLRSIRKVLEKAQRHALCLQRPSWQPASGLQMSGGLYWWVLTRKRRLLEDNDNSYPELVFVSRSVWHLFFCFKKWEPLFPFKLKAAHIQFLGSTNLELTPKKTTHICPYEIWLLCVKMTKKKKKQTNKTKTKETKNPPKKNTQPKNSK